MEVSLIEGNSSSQHSYLSQSQSSNISTIDKYLVPEKHLSYFYDIANVGRKTGKRRKSVEKDSDGMDNISDFFGEDESDDESEDPDDKDELDTIDGYSNNGETTDGIDESNDNSEKNEENLNNNVENSENEIKEPFLIQNNKIKNNNKEISMSLEEAVERLQKIIEETPSKSKIDMTPVLNSVLKASKLNNENNSLYSYNALQEAKLRKKMIDENNKENVNSMNSKSITQDKIYEYEEDIKDISSDEENLKINNEEKDEIFETESSDDDEIIIDVGNGERKSSNKFKFRNSKYRSSDTETELDLHYTSNSESESDIYDYDSEDSEEIVYSLMDNNKKNNNNKNRNDNNNKYNSDSSYPEYQEIKELSNKKRSSKRITRQSLLLDHFNNEENRESISKNDNNDLIDINDISQNNIDFNGENNNNDNKSISDMSITKESSTTSIEKIERVNEHEKKKEVEIDKKELEIRENKKEKTNKKTKEPNEISTLKLNNESVDSKFNSRNKVQQKETSETVEKNTSSNNDINNNTNDSDDDNDFNNDFNIDNIDFDISNNEIIQQDTNEENEEIAINIDQYEHNEKGDNDENEINNQVNNTIASTSASASTSTTTSISKSKSKSKTKGKKKNSPSVTVSVNVNTGTTHKRKRYEIEEVPLRKSSRKRIPPCKYWEGERPEDLLVLNEDQIKERQIKREQEIEKENQWMRKKKRRTRKVIKKEETEKHQLVKTVDASTSPIKALSLINSEVDFSKSLSHEFKDEFTTCDIYTKKESKKRIAVTQKMLKPQPVNNSSYRFTKIFSEDLIFATGLLLFPKDSFKPNRNSKDNILLFFVMTGEIEVQIHKTSFTVYAGDHFMVPKGNQYQIKNLKDVDSKVWFVQCKAKKRN
ncbi:hypothetical protein H8356DRAFT_986354 [Neocallimastix lanati (nom. inval.)]|nr:hypothetical protein H8356DRAFT_986354 [Neocallimastix sp. JGI-2020a]